MCLPSRMGVKKLRNKNKGFTLIELLVVIAIIGLLASVVLLALNSARAKSRDAKRLADMRQLASAMELYFNDYNQYPSSSGGSNGPSALSAQAIAAAPSLGSMLAPKYIGLIPTEPTPSDCTAATGNGSNQYYWQGGLTSNANNYTITFCLGAATGGYSSGPHTLSPAGIQ